VQIPYASVQAAHLIAVPSTVVLGGICILRQTGHTKPSIKRYKKKTEQNWGDKTSMVWMDSLSLVLQHSQNKIHGMVHKAIDESSTCNLGPLSG
jgi:hypothetical protein